MQRTIPCTNPNCETEIIVPAGAMQVVCENCSTWHFPAPQAESEGSYAASTDSPGNYDAPPPLSEKVNLPPPTGYGVPEQESPVAARYDAPESLPPVVPPRNSFGAENTAAETNVGCLVTDSGVRLQLREGRNVIGRKNTDLVIEDRTVSRRHCVVEIFVDAEGKKNILFTISVTPKVRRAPTVYFSAGAVCDCRTMSACRCATECRCVSEMWA